MGRSWNEISLACLVSFPTPIGKVLPGKLGLSFEDDQVLYVLLLCVLGKVEAAGDQLRWNGLWQACSRYNQE